MVSLVVFFIPELGCMPLESVEKELNYASNDEDGGKAGSKDRDVGGLVLSRECVHDEE